MHGRVKVKTDSQKELEKRLEKEKKCKQFLIGQKKAFEKRSREEYDSESLAICGQLLSVNPDFYTLWNFRREIILRMKSEPKGEENSDSFEKLCRNELILTENCLRVNPKSYCVWHQRAWIIEQMPTPDLRTEISLCNQLLLSDERNFHCWDYRRYVSKLAQNDVFEELEFTLQKIQQNFSNFSSWYYRSGLFTIAANNEKFDFTEQWKKEYELVENAIFTDPTDQSAWFYHKWLVSTNYGNNMKHSQQLNRENSVKVNRIVFNRKESLLIVGFSRHLKHKPLMNVTINDILLANVDWNRTNDSDSNIWFTTLESIPDNQLLKLTIRPMPTFAVNPESIELIDIEVEANEEQMYVFERQSDDSNKHLGLEECYLKTLRELHKLEPNNKWVNLTLAWNDPNRAQIVNILDGLIELDPLRVNYYNDLKSKTILKERIESFQSIDSVLLNDLKITALYDCNRLTHIRSLDLSGNKLLKLSKTFNNLLSLEVLIMDSNKIYTIDKDLKFNKLKVLSLNNNKIFQIESLNNLRNSDKLQILSIKDNPISSALKDRSNSEIQLSDGLQIISSDSDKTTSDYIFDTNYNLSIFYKLF